MFIFKSVFITILSLFVFLQLEAQQMAVLKGKVMDENNKPMEFVSVGIVEMNIGGMTDAKGVFQLKVLADKPLTFKISYLGYESQTQIINLKPGTEKTIAIGLKPTVKDKESVNITANQNRLDNSLTLSVKDIQKIPTASGDFNALLFSQPGVSSRNELSSTYSVRGGNFDENLVYVNDIEVYRPFLVRAGEQEGLSFVNSDLVSSVNFSTGGFDAKYGDKMSSVLDIKYKKPKEFGGTASASFMGANVSLEGTGLNSRLTYLLGFRQKSNQFILNSLDTKGDYKPSFTDLQTYITYLITERLEISFLGNFSRNKYQFTPTNRQTVFGTNAEALAFKVYFDGREVDNYQTMLGALALTYRPSGKNNLMLKMITSVYQADESQTYDIMGQYWLDELETNPSGGSLGNVAFNKGVGTFLEHARDNLTALVYSFEHKGIYEKGNAHLLWGVKYQHEEIESKINEWKMVDSSGYTIPHNADSVGYTSGTSRPQTGINLSNVLNADNNVNSNRISSYLQNSWTILLDSSKLFFTLGLRESYWDFNKELLFSPRASIALKPNSKKDMLFRFSSGYYYQPPFYKEMQMLDGTINHNIKAQRSIHFVLGHDYYLKIWNRPFKLVTEAYYKFLDNLIPYKVDNVKIMYYGQNVGEGYARGIDIKLNGELVKGMESWVSLSYMKTEEKISTEFYTNSSGEKVNPGFIPRPTDQRLTFSMFFQDYLPKYPSYKMHLNLIFGTGLPFGPPNTPRYYDVYRMPPYRRVDIGFSKILKSEDKQLSTNNPFRFFKSAWVSIEVFNLLDVSNTVSYFWVADASNRQYAIPNYLTGRTINLKLQLRF